MSLTPRVCVWLLVGLGVVLPRGGLTGHPDVDVWNHAWGLWWAAESLRAGELPWFTQLAGAPDGGVLYYIDPLAAIVSLPVTLLAGPHVAYETVLVVRIALAGLAAQACCEELFGEGPHGWLAGVAFATTPMLLCELHNGITETLSVWWTPACLLAAVRASRRQDRRDWILLGLAVGGSVLANFYYGLVNALAVAAFLLVVSRNVRGALLAGAVGGLVAAPGALVLRASLAHPHALVARAPGLNRELAEHNAVDPRTYVALGAFSSVDLEKRYGEAFLHTGQLRWTVILLALGAVAMAPRRRGGWLLLLLASLILGLGPQLWFDGRFVVWGRQPMALPFAWLQRLIPELAITHPLRLSVVGQAMACVLAGGALVGRPRLLVAVMGAAAAAEAGFFTLARWPLVEAPADIPALYAEIAASSDERGVLELPGDIGTSMATSRYFWYQTTHGHPLPYKPDARASDNGDPTTFAHFPSRFNRTPRPLDDAGVAHLEATYGWVIVHPDLERRAGAVGAFRAVLEPAFGAPVEREGMLVWSLRQAR